MGSAQKLLTENKNIPNFDSKEKKERKAKTKTPKLPTTLLAEPLFKATNCDLRSLGMQLTNLMAPVVISTVA